MWSDNCCLRPSLTDRWVGKVEVDTTGPITHTGVR